MRDYIKCDISISEKLNFSNLLLKLFVYTDICERTGSFHTCIIHQHNIYSKFSKNSEAKASEFLVNLEKMFPGYYVDSDEKFNNTPVCYPWLIDLRKLSMQ